MVKIHRIFTLPVPAEPAYMLNLGEPSVGASGNRIFAAGNCYALRSLDGGTSWQDVPPQSTLQPGPVTQFCCDQTVLHVPSRDLMVWILQYKKKIPDGNTIRVAVSRRTTLQESDWMWWDFTASSIKAEWTGEWLDYNHAAASDNFLYIGSNIFAVDPEQFRRSIVLRIPLDELAESEQLSAECLESADNGSLRCTAGATATMYVVGHHKQRQLRIWRWPEIGDPTITEVDVAPWIYASKLSVCPDGMQWLNRCDTRITAAWVAHERIGVAWSAAQVPPKRPHPYVRVVILNEADFTIASQPDIWSDDHAYAYPDVCPNADGVAGVSVFRGGGTMHPGHLVGVLDEATGMWDISLAVQGTNGPLDGTWGDYVTCRRMAPDATRWMAAGFTLQGGKAPADIRQHLVEFGV